MSIQSALKNGLFVHQGLGRLQQVGIAFSPYYLVRENIDQVAVAKFRAQDILPSGFSVLSLTSEPTHINLVSGLNNWATPEEVNRRLALGHKCIVLRNGEETAGYTWADTTEVNDSMCTYDLRSDEAYLYDAFISDKFRGGGLASKMRLASYAELYAHGIRQLVSVSDCFNSGSIKFKSRLGAQPEALFLNLRIAGKQIFNWRLKQYPPETTTWHPG